MAIFIFIVLLVVLILVHEFGHFITARIFGIRVEEFGIGYPPRALTFARSKGTDFTLNWLPFGGFVKVHGEDGEDASSPDSFSAKPWYEQALVIAAGILMNLLFAWLLLSLTLSLGMTRSLTEEEAAKAPDASIAVAEVVPGSPAAKGALAAGDFIKSASFSGNTFSGHDPAAFADFIARDTAAAPITLSVLRGRETRDVVVTPEAGLSPVDAKRVALGIAVGVVGTLPVPLVSAPVEGAKLTYEITRETAVALAAFFAHLATFSADLSQISGPVGIVGAVGSASAQGATALLTLAAVISINLALINLLPVPALDGGRLLFVLIEAVIRRRIPAKVAGTVNMVGFSLLILLMVVVTAHDIFKLFN